MFMKKLTKSQAKVFDFLKESIADGITPSVREICLATIRIERLRPVVRVM